MQSNSRRNFFKRYGNFGILALAAGFIPLSIPKTKGKKILALSNEEQAISLFGIAQSSMTKDQRQAFNNLAIPSKINIWDTVGNFQEILLAFNPHEITQSPTHPRLAFASQRWGEYAAEIDLVSKTVTRTLKAGDKNRFYGHSLYSSDGRFLFLSMMDDQEGNGYANVYDAVTLQLIKRIPSGGMNPHALIWEKKGPNILIANSGAAKNDVKAYSNVSWLNSVTGTLDGSVRISEKTQSVAHLQVDNMGYVVYSGSPANSSQPDQSIVVGGIDPKKNKINFVYPKKFGGQFFGEALSILLVENLGYAFVTLPDAGYVVLFHYPTGQFIKEFAISQPKGIGISTKENLILVSGSNGKEITAINLDKLKTETKINYAHLGGNGSHYVLLKNLKFT